MAIRRYLAMTAEEIARAPSLPEGAAGMYCPFSQGAGASLSTDVLVLTDHTPADSRAASAVIHQILTGHWEAVLLDFQRPGNPEALSFAKALLQALPCPTVVSTHYAGELNCPVFLPPLPLCERLREYIAPWNGREIWLDIGTEGLLVTLTKEGAFEKPLPHFPGTEKHHADTGLHCHYSVSVSEDKAEFILWRTREDLEALLQEAEQCGVKAAVGLYQELMLIK